jgi:hypothetical protein
MVELPCKLLQSQTTPLPNHEKNPVAVGEPFTATDSLLKPRLSDEIQRQSVGTGSQEGGLVASRVVWVYVVG